MQKVQELKNLHKDSQAMVKTLLTVNKRCNNEFTEFDFTHLDQCYRVEETFNKMMQTFKNATNNDSATIMGFGQ